MATGEGRSKERARSPRAQSPASFPTIPGSPTALCQSFPLPQEDPFPPSPGMEKKPLCQPSMAWEEDRASQDRSSSLEPYEECTVQPLHPDASWLAVYEEEKETVDFIQAFSSSPSKEDDQKIKFLESVCILCINARCLGLSEGLDIFCQRCELAENIQEMLEEEPREELCTKMRWLAMLAIAELSSVETVLEGKKKGLLEACLSGVFWLRPEEAMGNLEKVLYVNTLEAMDNMLTTMVTTSPASEVSEELQDIFQVLLEFTESERADVRERVVGRIRTLSNFLASSSSWRAGQHEDSCVSYQKIQIPNFGVLLGHLLLLTSFQEEETSHLALDSLFDFFMFSCQQNGAALPADDAQLPEPWEADITFLLNSLRASDFMMSFGKYLESSERTQIVCQIIVAMRDFGIYDKELASSMMEVVIGDPDLWLVDVPDITKCIHQNLKDINTATAWKSVDSLLVLVANRSPGEVVRTLLWIAPPGDSTAMAMWEALFSVPQTLESILKELLVQLQDRQNKLLYSYQEDTCILRLAILACTGLEEEEFETMYKVYPFLRYQNPMMLSLVLRGLMTLSKGAEMARKMRVFLPDMVGLLQSIDEEVRWKALVVICNVMGHLKREEASPIAVELVELLLPLFDECTSQMRELSIGLFRDLVKVVVGKNKSEMKKKVPMGLLQLFFHMSDETWSVAEVSGEALLAAAKLLKWKQLQHLVETQQIWRIGECLLVQDKRRTEKYLDQSLLYLNDAQFTLREMAVRFIGLAARPLRNQNEEKLSQIIKVLQLVTDDSELSIHCLAVQTICILSAPRVQGRAGRGLRALCCPCC